MDPLDEIMNNCEEVKLTSWEEWLELKLKDYVQQVEMVEELKLKDSKLVEDLNLKGCGEMTKEEWLERTWKEWVYLISQ